MNAGTSSPRTTATASSAGSRFAVQASCARTTGAVSGDREVDLGAMAHLTIGGVGVAVTSKRMQAHDQAPFRHLGIEPSQQRILALKSTCHFRAEFEPIAERVIVVIAPGGYLADPARYPYARLRPGVRLRPLGPDSRPSSRQAGISCGTLRPVERLMAQG